VPALLLQGSVHAAKTAGETGAPAPLGVESLLTTLIGLGFILALIFGAGWVLKRTVNLPGGGKGLVKILGGASLGSRERIVVVEVEETRLVLGIAPGRVQTLHVLDGDAEFPRALRQAREQGP
jgi:flagellar protein FliO/FliZ